MKSYLLISFLLITLSAIGQERSIQINYKPSFTYFGRQVQSFHNYYFASRKGDPTFNSCIDILYSQKLSSRASITTGLEYSQQGQNINFNADSVFPSNNRKILKIELTYLRIPIIVQYSILKMEKAELNISSGVSLGVAVKRKDNYQGIILENTLLPPAEERYKNNDWAIPLGINYKKYFTSSLYANFGGEYLLGLNDAFKENAASKFGVLSEFKDSKQSRFALVIGIGFNLAKQNGLKPVQQH